MTVSVDHRVAWAALALAGVAANARTLAAALRRRRRVRESGRNGPLRVLADQGVRGECVTLLVQCLLASLAVASAWHPAGIGPVPTGLTGTDLARGWMLATCSLVLLADSLLSLRDRRRLFRYALDRPACQFRVAMPDTFNGTEEDGDGDAGAGD